MGTDLDSKLSTGTNDEEPQDVIPEAAFEAAVLSTVRRILEDCGTDYFEMPRLGLDAGFLIMRPQGSSIKLIEFKCYRMGRIDGVGFGSARGKGIQVHILSGPMKALHGLGDFIRWAFVDTTRPAGAPRYALLDCVTARASAMAVVSAGKQNNFSIEEVRRRMADWRAFVKRLREFLLGDY